MTRSGLKRGSAAANTVAPEAAPAGTAAAIPASKNASSASSNKRAKTSTAAAPEAAKKVAAAPPAAATVVAAPAIPAAALKEDYSSTSPTPPPATVVAAPPPAPKEEPEATQAAAAPSTTTTTPAALPPSDDPVTAAVVAAAVAAAAVELANAAPAAAPAADDTSSVPAAGAPSPPLTVAASATTTKPAAASSRAPRAAASSATAAAHPLQLQQQSNEQWVTNFDHCLFQLLAHKVETGNYHVPKDHELHPWMLFLKREFKQHCQGGGGVTSPPCLLTDRQVKVLEFLHVPLTSRGDEHWNRFYDLLQDYKERHGHVLVPRLCEVPGLGDWVTDQRRQYKAWKQGQVSQLSQERREKLERLGACVVTGWLAAVALGTFVVVEVSLVFLTPMSSYSIPPLSLSSQALRGRSGTVRNGNCDFRNCSISKKSMAIARSHNITKKTRHWGSG